MAGMTDTVEVALLNWLLNAPTAFLSNPAGLYLSLHTADDDTGSSELSGNGYVRQNVQASFPTASGATGIVLNDVAIVFPVVTGSNWATITHFGLWSAVSGGTCYFIGTITSPIAVLVGQQYSIGIGQLAITAA
jgi:hypothetical protein